MKNKVSKYHTAPFFFCSMFAIITGLSIEIFTTIPLISTGGIGNYVSFVTMIGLPLAFLKFKYFQQNKTVTIALTPVNSKKHP